METFDGTCFVCDTNYEVTMNRETIGHCPNCGVQIEYDHLEDDDD